MIHLRWFAFSEAKKAIIVAGYFLILTKNWELRGVIFFFRWLRWLSQRFFQTADFTQIEFWMRPSTSPFDKLREFREQRIN